jgi:hypothetical protein
MDSEGSPVTYPVGEIQVIGILPHYTSLAAQRSKEQAGKSA